MFWIKSIVIIYLVVYVSTIFHEVGHLIAAKVIKLKKVTLYIGKYLFVINTKKVKISPVLSFSAIEMDYEEMMEKSKKQIFLLYILGPIFTLILFFIGIFIINTFLGFVIIVFNGIMFIISLIPFINDSDANHIILLIKKRSEN